MTAQKKDPTRSEFEKAGPPWRAIGAYYFSLVAAGFASAFPTGRVWGLSWWGYFPRYAPFMAFAVAAVFPLALVLRRESSAPKKDMSRAQYFISVSGIAIILTALFIFLRGQIHFLGDGYLQISLLSHPDPVIKPREYGGMGIPTLIASLIKDYSLDGAIRSYQIVSIGAGVLLIATAAMLSRSIFGRRRDSLLFLAGTLSGGYLLLFFGYVENYALFAVSVMTFALAGILAAKSRISKWWAVLTFGVSSFFHIFGVTLLPALLFLFVRETGVGRKLSVVGKRMKLGLAAAGLLLAAIGLYVATVLDPNLRYSLMPITSGPLTVEGYTLFSSKHLIDLVNLIVLLVPGILVLLVSIKPKQFQSIRRDPAFVFLGVLMISALGTITLLDPKLGMPRDWDVFAYAGVPCVVTLSYLYIAHASPRLHRFPAIALFAALGWMALFPRAISQVMPEIGLAHLHNYFELDVAKNGPCRQVLIGYDNDLGDHDAALKELRAMDLALPDGPLCDSAVHLSDRGRYGEAIPLLRKVMELNPLNNSGWLNLADCYEQTGRFDTALTYLKTADALNPNSANIMNSFAWVYLGKKEYDLAEKYWRRTLNFDRDALAAQLGLATLYFQTGRRDKEVECLNTLFRRADLPADYFRQLGDALLSNQDSTMALAGYELSIKRGLSSAAADSLKTRFPQLRSPIR